MCKAIAIVNQKGGVVLCDTEKINEYIVANCKMLDDADDEEFKI